MLHQKQVKSVLNKHKKRDDWFLDDYSVNPYEGCSCNCLYCYIRGSKYGVNMDARLAVKSNALEVLDKQLMARAKKQQYGYVAVGSGTDAYLNHEEDLKMTRGFLELLLKHRFPVFISTKRALILRDLDLLQEIDKNAILPAGLVDNPGRGVILSVSISTLDEQITSMLEPAAIPPAERLRLIQELKTAGFLAGVNAIPLLPYISDTEEQLEMIFEAIRFSNAEYVLAGSLTLFGSGVADSKTLFYKFLERYDRDLIPRYRALFGEKFYTPFHYQQLLKTKTDKLCAKFGLRNSIQF